MLKNTNRICQRLFLCIFLSFSFQGLFGQQDIPSKVLFVGNSYTYFWNLPLQVEIMANSQNVPMETRHSTSGGVNLGMHWRGERKLQTVDRIKSKEYDAVVIQDHSLRAIQYPDSLLLFGNRFSDLIKANDAQPFVYMTWSRKWNPLMQAQITKMYRKLAQDNGATIVPVGPAWEMARTLRPDMELYDPDGSHPGTVGSYLSACVFYYVLTGKSPQGLPNRLIQQDEHGENQYVMILSANDAAFCQDVAKKTVDTFK